MKKIAIAIIMMTSMSQAYWQTQCDEDANCEQVWIQD